MESDTTPPGAALGRWWGQSPQPSPSTDVMNQLCRVCGEPAAGFHFGAFTCEGCKSFFGRTYNNLGSITECKNNGECVINKKNRTACKACRLRKCLLVGMSKSGSRYGRRSNWFKIHCLLQEQQQAVGNSHLKDKAALALWGESYKSLTTPPPHADGDSKGSPTEDNNNLPKERERSPSRTQLQPGYSAEAAAALWAARHSLFPMQLPHHPMAALPVPYLPSFGSFPPPGHPQPQRNLLLPFMHNLQSSHSPASPQPLHHRPMFLSSSPSRSSRGSTCSQSPSPNRNHLQDSCDKSSVEDEQTDEQTDGPTDGPTDGLTDGRQCESTDGDKVVEEHSLAILRALGPVQDHPMDLSLRVVSLKNRRKSKASRRIDEDSGGGSGSDCDGEGEGEGEGAGKTVEVICENPENNDENFNKRKNPLDLTKPAKLEL